MWASDFRHAVRHLTKRPGFSVSVVLILALGLGINLTLFSVVHGVLLRDLPFRAVDELAVVWPDGSFTRGGFDLYHDGAEAFAAVAGYGYVERLSLTGVGEPLRIEGVQVTADYFEVLGVPPLHGRLGAADLSAADDWLVLGHDLFVRRFGADPSVVGRTVTLDGADRRVVAVATPELRFPGNETQAWLAAPRGLSGFEAWSSPTSLRAVGRLRPGMSLRQAQAELATLMPEIRDGFPWPMPETFGAEATVVSVREHVVGAVRPTLMLLAGAAGFVLLIACVNVGSLFLVRLPARRREMAIRSALGAEPGRLVRQLLGESLLLSGVAALLALGLGAVALRGLRGMLPTDLPGLDRIAFDGPVFAVGAALALSTGLIAGLVPAWQAARSDLRSPLASGSTAAGLSRGQHRYGSLLLMAEVALTVVLTIGAGLLIRSFAAQLGTGPGFDTSGAVTARVAPPETVYATDAARRTFYAEVEQRLGAVPTVERVGWVSHVPFRDTMTFSVFEIEGRPIPNPEDWPRAEARMVVDESFLPTLGMTLLRGRRLTADDRADVAGVALVGRSLAERYWPAAEGQPVGAAAVGARFRFPGGGEWKTIVGVVEDVRLSELTEAPLAALYLPMAQEPVGPMSLLVRGGGDLAEVRRQITAAVASVDDRAPVSAVATLEGVVAESLDRPRLLTSLVLAFTLLALILATAGIYGVTRAAVDQRRRELAIRGILGETGRQLLARVGGRGLALAAVGVLVGLGMSLLLGRWLESVLYEVSATDPVTFAAVGLGLALITVAASVASGARALAIDPAEALRSE